MINLELEIEKISPQENDIIIIKSPKYLSKEEVEIIQKTLHDVISKYDYLVQAILIMGNMSVEKLSQEELKQLVNK